MSNDQKTLTIQDIPFPPELQKRIEAFRKDWYQSYKRISKQKTPTYDGLGKQVVKKRPDGKDYIDDAWMSDRLNKYFPGWSWEAAAPLHFLGSEWVVAQGCLAIIDERLLAFGINPPVRKFYAVDSVRIQYKRDAPHTPENIIDVGDNCQSAVTGAKKRAINRLCGIGDDIYGKRIEEEGAGTLEDIIAGSTKASTNVQYKAFTDWLAKHKVPVGEALRILGIKNMQQIKDFKKAQEDIAGEKGL